MVKKKQKRRNPEMGKLQRRSIACKKNELKKHVNVCLIIITYQERGEESRRYVTKGCKKQERRSSCRGLESFQSHVKTEKVKKLCNYYSIFMILVELLNQVKA